MRKSAQRAVLALGAVTAVAGSMFISSSPAMAAAPTPTAACGGNGYHVVKGGTKVLKVKGSSRKVATVYLMYNNRTGTNCVITWKAHPRDHEYITAGIIKRGQKWNAKNSHSAYVLQKLSARGACIKWGGYYEGRGSYWWSPKWGHCGK